MTTLQLLLRMIMFISTFIILILSIQNFMMRYDIKKRVVYEKKMEAAIINFRNNSIVTQTARNEERNVIFDRFPLNDKEFSEWHIWNDNNNTIYIHRAILDSRKFKSWKTPAVTLLVLSNTRKTRNLGEVYCSYELKDTVVKRRAKIILPVEAFRYKITKLQEFAIHCPIDEVFPIPTFVTVERNNSRATLKIERPYPGSDFMMVCVPLVYGSFNPSMLVEWFEYLKYFGISMVEIPMWEVSENVSKIFNYYEKEKFLVLSKMEIPFEVVLDQPKNPLHPSKKPNFLKAFVPIALNECLLMNSLRAKYILSLDLDEFVFLNTSVYPNFRSLVDVYVKNIEPTTVQVQMGKIKFDVSCGYKIPNQHFLMTHKYREELSKMKYGDNPKSFMNVNTCPFIGNHYCMWVFEREQRHRLRVLPNECFIAHFRKYDFCGPSVSEYIIDDTLKNIEFSLSNQFSKVKKELGFMWL